MLYIDYKSPVPVWEQVYNGILKLAALGALAPGGQLPSVRSVAQSAGVNPNTVQKAYAALERDGLICSLPGRGSFLAEQGDLLADRQRRALDALRKAAAQCRDAGVSPEDAARTVEETYAADAAPSEKGEKTP